MALAVSLVCAAGGALWAAVQAGVESGELSLRLSACQGVQLGSMKRPVCVRQPPLACSAAWVRCLSCMQCPS